MAAATFGSAAAASIAPRTHLHLLSPDDFTREARRSAVSSSRVAWTDLGTAPLWPLVMTQT